MLNARRGITEEQAALHIGAVFPEIGDKLLNIIQLRKYQGSLVQASISQKAASIKDYYFPDAVDIRQNKRYLKYVIIPLAIILGVLLLSPSFLTTSSTRILQFNNEFVPQAPFNFVLKNNELLAFKNEDFTLNLSLTGSAIPENVYLITNDRKIKMAKLSAGEFTYTFKKIQDDKAFKFEAAGFFSSLNTIKVVNRPNLRNFNVYLDYPAYLGKKNERLNNVGNLQIPEGTSVKWQLNTLQSDEVSIEFQNAGKEINLKAVDNQLFEYEDTFKESQIYGINLKNEYSENKEKILYKIDVIPDQYPQIDLNVYQDTTLYSFIALGGNISDDYGLRQLKLYYQIVGQHKQSEYTSINIPIASRQSSQRYYYQWYLDSLELTQGSSIRYYLQVWDNDGVNGSKTSKTGTYVFKIPSRQEVKKDIEKTTNETEKNIDKTVEEAKELREKLEKAEKKLKGKKDLNWQDENLMKDIIKKREELNKAIEELKEQNRSNELKRERFSKQDERMKEKVEQLQKLMDELLDEETKKLYEELKKLLEEKSDVEEIQDALKRLNNKENNLEKELERTLELFKRMKFDYKLNEAIDELNKQIEKQEELIEETSDKNREKEDLIERQDQLQEKFKEFKEDMGALKELNQELKNPESLPNTGEEEKAIEQEQQESKESLENNKRKKAKESQQKAKQQMQKMSDKLQQMQSSMEMTMMQENLDDLRDIVHNLLKLSFDQEKLMTEFSEVNQSDPRFVELGQFQLKLQDDAQIVEDSLLALAKRVFQIESFVTREVADMNDHMEKSVEAIKERKKPIATSEQQFAMTSMNNLALLLDDVLQQMQNAMSEAMGKPQKGKGKDKMPSLSELQQQLNEKIDNLKKSGKSGRQLSEELAKLAAEQERIRQALQEMQEKMGPGDNGNKPGDGIPEKMEETEIDLVNKQITEQTIKRQKEILTRLLEAENAMRERELDEERKGETAKDYEKALPKAFEEYFKMKEKEIELLKTVPPKLYPYYKQEVNDYFKRLGKEPNN
ncbi:liver stage antigen, putative [Fulvivirga imtechensis AK7]|uniref:Liver stage antigen, putative n=2 Tax=Fulvivirga TaxID=396811 RepID=L8JT48_9BACT|nr:liver stage antigen, putative [Fulvivirga imtechensis AK7]